MRTLLTHGKREQPGSIGELLNAMVPDYWTELPKAANNKSAVPSTSFLRDKREMILRGTCDPFGALIPLAEDALTMGVSLATVKAPYLQAIAHFDVCARRQSRQVAKPLYLHVDEETRVQQKLDRVQHRVLRDENDVEVLQQAAALCRAQIKETTELQEAIMQRISEVVTPRPLTVPVRWTRGAVHA